MVATRISHLLAVVAAGLTSIAVSAVGQAAPASITPITPISVVQGAGATTPLAGQTVTVEAVVTSLFERQDILDGYFVQEQDADADGDPATSEGLFVFCRGFCPPTLTTGDLVEVTGSAGEFFGMTQLSANAAGATTIVSSGTPLPVATVVDLPAATSTQTAGTFESVEGMVVTIPQTLAVSEYFQLARFGQIVLTETSRPYQYTHVESPDVAGYADYLAELGTRRIILDDDNNDNNDAISNGPDEPYPYPHGGLSVSNRFRGGDTITDLTGVMHWSFAGGSNTDAWRIRPIVGQDYTFTPANPVPTLAEVGGDVRVASFNVLNYFTTIDETSSSSTGPCGPAGTADCRGADSEAELDQQRAKIVAALTTIDADVVGLIEIQNDDGASADDLVAAMNAATAPGTYAAVDTGFVGTDAIKVALVYQPATVSPVGDFAILDASIDPRFVDTSNRPALVQSFEEVASGERFTVAVNHLKSKGSDCDSLGDPDLGDGQGNCNLIRTAAAEALADFLATDPTGSGDPDVLVIGDLNSYRNEDPITALTTAGYTDLVRAFEGDDAYSFVFDGQLGYLDHALANASLAPQVTGVTTWHVNADEVVLFDYNDDILDVGEQSFERESSALELDATDALRSSDHDPLVVGLDLSSAPVDQPLRLTLLHNNDGESSLLPAAPIGGIARFATLVDDLRDDAASEPGNADSLLVSSGDNYLAGPQLQASLDNYDGDTDYSDDGPFYDAMAVDALDYDASAVGNHEFDFGPGAFGFFISQFDTSNIRFVSANLDVSGDAALAQFVATPPGESATLVEWTRVEAGGQSVAIVGATTPRLASISSPGPDVVVDEDVRAAVQGAIDEATADGTDIVILISHLQNIVEDQALLAELSGVDIAVAGGGDELLANADDVLLPGASAPFGPYPLIQEAADGADVPIVTTQGSYGYVGRLIVDIDVDGNVTAIDDRSGPVRNVFDPVAPPADQVEPDPVLLAEVEAPVAAYVADLQGDVIATTEPALDGVTANVRTRETNLGSLFADALRISAEESVAEFGAIRPTVGLTNSGGIRNSLVLGPNGPVTTFDTFRIAPFSNFVAAVPDVTATQLKQLVERAVSANVTAGALQPEGRFAQVSGMNIVYDPAQVAQQVARNADGTVDITTPGQRVRQLTLTLNDDDVSNDIVVVRNGEIVSGAPNVDLATNSFTVTNGDNYPFNLAQGEFVNLPVTYQQSLADQFIRLGTVTSAAYPEGGLGRIVVGGDVPVIEALSVDRATLFLGTRGGGSAVVSGSVADSFTGCPTLTFAIDGTETVTASTVAFFGSRLCLAITNQGFVTFDRRSSSFSTIVTLPRSFRLADDTVEFSLVLDGVDYTTEVTGRRVGSIWFR
jgi:predicted extracellular nuclease/2',3'-cyclic-nucleotide 2'-phosphodiesterase (5'-nucleotidase family)